MERPRVDYDSGTIHGRSHPWVGPAVEGFERGLEKGHLRLLTTKSHGDYPADWFTGAIGERRYDIEGGDPRTPLTASEAATTSAHLKLGRKWSLAIDKLDHRGVR